MSLWGKQGQNLKRGDRMADYRYNHEAPIRAHERGRMGAGDHPLADGRLANALGAKSRGVRDPTPIRRERSGITR